MPDYLTSAYMWMHMACQEWCEKGQEKGDSAGTDLSRLSLATTFGAGMPELDFAGEELGAGARDPGHHRLGDPFLLQRIHQAVLVLPAQLSQDHNEFDLCTDQTIRRLLASQEYMLIVFT